MWCLLVHSMVGLQISDILNTEMVARLKISDVLNMKMVASPHNRCLVRGLTKAASMKICLALLPLGTSKPPILIMLLTRINLDGFSNSRRTTPYAPVVQDLTILMAPSNPVSVPALANKVAVTRILRVGTKASSSKLQIRGTTPITPARVKATTTARAMIIRAKLSIITT